MIYARPLLLLERRSESLPSPAGGSRPWTRPLLGHLPRQAPPSETRPQPSLGQPARSGILFGALGLLACGPKDEPPDPPSSEIEILMERDAAPDRTGDPLRFEAVLEVSDEDGRWDQICPGAPRGYCKAWRPEPMLRGPDGSLHRAEPLLKANGELWAWAVPEGSPAGDWSIVGVWEAPEVFDETTPTFTILDFGAAGAADLDELVVQSWDLVGLETWPTSLGSLIMSLLLPITLDVRGTSEAPRLRVILESQAGHCALLEADATWEPSTLAWSETELSIDHPELGTLRVEGPAIELVWASDGNTDARANIDLPTDALALLFPELLDSLFGSAEPEDVCRFLANFGETCVSCEIGEADCIRVRAGNAELIPRDEPLPDDLPLCGVNLLDTVQDGRVEFEFEIPECSCASGPVGGPWWLLLVVGWFRRRSRGGGSGRALVLPTPPPAPAGPPPHSSPSSRASPSVAARRPPRA